MEFKNTRHGAQNKSQKRHVSVPNLHPHKPNIISTAARLASQPRSTRASANCLSTIWRSLDNTVPPSPKGDMVASAQKIKAHPEAKRKQSVAVQPPEKAALWCGIRPKWGRRRPRWMTSKTGVEESSAPEDLMIYGRDDGRGERVEATLQGKSTSEKGERILPHEIGIM